MVGHAEGVAVSLDAALGIEHEAIVAGAFRELLKIVGKHSIEPAQAVCAADGDLSAVAKVECADAFRKRGELLGKDAEDREAESSTELLQGCRRRAEPLGKGGGRAHLRGLGRVWRGSHGAGGSVLHSGSLKKIIAFRKRATGGAGGEGE